ncbi:MAG: phosphomannomutase, partial [Shewanella sp.]
DAVLPFLMLLAAAGKDAISPLVGALPARYTYSDRIKDFAIKRSQDILAQGLTAPQQLLAKLGFYEVIASTDNTDGLRVTLANKDIIHLRASGNAPELRCYAESASVKQAQALVTQVLSKIITLS